MKDYNFKKRLDPLAYTHTRAFSNESPIISRPLERDNSFVTYPLTLTR